MFVHFLCCLGAIFSRVPGSHLSIRALGSQGRPQGPPRVPPNKIIPFPIRFPIRSCHGMTLLAHIPNKDGVAGHRNLLDASQLRNYIL